jgi:hypothetical protein
VPAKPQSRLAAVNSAVPARKTRQAPIRSPSRPASSSRPAKETRYAFTTQATPAGEKPSSRWMVGTATATTVPSSTIIRAMAQSTARVAPRRSVVMTRP